MEPQDFLDLSQGVQTALGAGYLAYVTAYAGLRRAHTALDTLFITLAFGLVAGAAFQLAEPRGMAWAIVAGVVAALIAGMCWRRFGRQVWQTCMRRLRIHLDDGIPGGWEALIQTTRAAAQISVHMKDGRVLYCNDTTPYDGAHLRGLYLGGDGSVVMVVEEEELPDGREEKRQGLVDPEWGTRLTYIPASEIARVNLRYG